MQFLVEKEFVGHGENSWPLTGKAGNPRQLRL